MRTLSGIEQRETGKVLVMSPHELAVEKTTRAWRRTLILHKIVVAEAEIRGLESVAEAVDNDRVLIELPEQLIST